MQNNSAENKTNINWYPGHMAKTKRLISENIKYIDIVYEVVDARIPKSSRIKEIDKILENKKRLIIMTKKDLCDVTKTNKIIKEFEEKGEECFLTNLNENFNKEEIINLTYKILKQDLEKQKNKGMLNRKVRALVIGIPNAGKSSLINKLAGKKVTNVGNRPGITKNLNWIRVNDKIELLDTPGILWPKLEQSTEAYNLAAFTAIKEEILPIFDITKYILKTLSLKYQTSLKERYNLDNVSDENILEALEIIGKKRGCLVKGGEVDYDKVCISVINDVKLGLIKGLTFDE
jgi:ribosome biogenesis GTPase A